MPCSDYSGEIAVVGEDARGKWTPGDRVCCNFAQMHVDGNAAPEAMSGGPVHGVLSQYVICPAEVCFSSDYNAVELNGASPGPWAYSRSSLL